MKLSKDKLIQDFIKFSNEWADTPEYNSYIYDYFDKQVELHKSLSKHNEIVNKYSLGYGEPAFRYLWALVFSQTSNNSKFLEIGVYKGSILALSQLISKELNIDITTYGLTPLNNTGDKYSMYPTDNYEYDISFLFHNLKLSTDKLYIIEGLSIDQIVKNSATNMGPYDVIYIDGGHDYETVINDIEFSDSVLNLGGLLIMDDASSDLQFRSNHPGFTGHADVARAIHDNLIIQENYKHLFACGHNRVWKKLNNK